MSEGVTELLEKWRGGDRSALDLLTPLIYAELRKLASAHMHREDSGNTLQSSDLAHEAYLKLVDQSRVQWKSRAHFFAVASHLVRRILVDHARARGRIKRGSAPEKLQLTDDIGSIPPVEVDLIDLNEALDGLEQLDPQQVRVVELRFFTGLSVKETAEALGISESTVKRSWSSARAWLLREMQRQQGSH